MWKLLSIVVALSLCALGLLMPKWDSAGILVYSVLWIIFGGAFVFLTNLKHGRIALRISAGVLGIALTLNAIYFTITPLQDAGSRILSGQAIVGSVVLGLPALFFAATGRSKHVDEHERTKESSE